MSVDFHIHPKQGVNSSWSATGHYYNDDGLVLDTTGNGNLYFLNATGNSSEPNNFSVSFTLQVAATNFNKTENMNCTAVNQNDYLGGLEFYNAQALVIAGANYTITGSFVNETSAPIGFAAFDLASNRLVTNITTPVCMSLLTNIVFDLVIPVPPVL